MSLPAGHMHGGGETEWAPVTVSKAYLSVCGCAILQVSWE